MLRNRNNQPSQVIVRNGVQSLQPRRFFKIKEFIGGIGGGQPSGSTGGSTGGSTSGSTGTGSSSSNAPAVNLPQPSFNIINKINTFLLNYGHLYGLIMTVDGSAVTLNSGSKSTTTVTTVAGDSGVLVEQLPDSNPFDISIKAKLPHITDYVIVNSQIFGAYNYNAPSDTYSPNIQVSVNDSPPANISVPYIAPPYYSGSYYMTIGPVQLFSGNIIPSNHINITIHSPNTYNGHANGIIVLYKTQIKYVSLKQS